MGLATVATQGYLLLNAYSASQELSGVFFSFRKSLTFLAPPIPFSKDRITKCDTSSVYKMLPQLAHVDG